MMKSEFEELALRNNVEISFPLYETIERFYTSDNEYHRTHGGIYETKQEFVKRVFGGKVNTPKTIVIKMIREAIKENTYALMGTRVSSDKTELDRMNTLIAEHITCLASMTY